MQNEAIKASEVWGPKGFPNLAVCFIISLLTQRTSNKVYERSGQLVLEINSEMVIPEDAPIGLLSA